MKRRIVFLGLVILLLAAAVYAAAEPLDTPNREVTWYIGLPENEPGKTNHIYSTRTVGQMWSPENVRDYQDLNIQWELESVSGPDQFELAWEPNNGWPDSYFCAEARPKSGTLTAGNSVYTMKATYKGVTYEGTLTIHAVSLQAPPAGMALKYAEFDPLTGETGSYTTVGNGSEVHIQTGKTFVLTGLFTGTAPGSADSHWLNCWGGDGFTELDRWNYTDSQGEHLFHGYDMVVEGNIPGRYDIGATMTVGDSNLEAMMNLRLLVEDAQGMLPEPKLTLRNYHDHINRYLGLTREIEKQEGVFSWNALACAEIESSVYMAMKDEYGGSPEWTVIQTAGKTLPITWEVENFGNWERADVRLESQALVDEKYQPGTAEITITCTWGKQTATTVTQVEIKNLPNGRPAGIDYNNGSDIVECRIGDILTVMPTILPANWGGIPGYDSVYAGNSGEFEEFCTVLREGPEGRILQVARAGEYECFVGIETDTVIAGRWMTYRVENRIREPWRLPENTTTIESEAFAGIPITQIDIPASVTHIADDAFDGCGLVIVYAHNEYVAEWARQHGIIAEE